MDDPAFLPDTTVDINTQTILLHASNHDLDALKPLLRIPGNASVQDPETGYTPLHAAIAACGPALPPKNPEDPTSETPNGTGKDLNGHEEKKEEEEEEYGSVEKGCEVVKELFLSGAIWNDLDSNNETPGCLAYRLGHTSLYNLCVEAGVRAELLLGMLGSYEPLADSDSDSEDENMEETEGEIQGEGQHHEVTSGDSGELGLDLEISKPDVNSEAYLKSALTFTPSALLDADSNGVMMSWETDIMRQTVNLLNPNLLPGKRILNIGFGMGIVDTMFAETKPLSHHIIEAHPGVISKLEEPDSKFGKEWKDSAPEGGEYIIHEGKWQDIVPKLIEKGELFDIIYFDTFAEDYSELKLFFEEYVVGLLDGEEGRFGWFNGLGADRRICYDVYKRVVECDLENAGLEVEWTVVSVPGELGEGMEKEGEGEWKGVRRRYWVLEEYWLPVCKFSG